jgi:hypothetical protein
MSRIKMFKIRILLLLFISFVFISCGNSGPSYQPNDQGTLSQNNNGVDLNFTAPDFLASITTPSGPETLFASVAIDGGSAQALTVNQSDNTVSGTLSSISAGSHSLVIQYYVNIGGTDIVLCTNSSTVSVTAGQTTTLTISPTGLNRNIDDDNDGWTNLAEVRLGTDTLSASSLPSGDSPYVLAGNSATEPVSSSGYKMRAGIGASIAGRVTSNSYLLILPYYSSDSEL